MGIGVGYTRFSTNKQESRAVQKTAINAAAEKAKDIIVEWFHEEPESGQTSDRQKFMLMFNAIKQGKLKVDKVYVFKFSRFMRNIEESRIFKRHLEAFGVDVVSALEPLPEDGYMADMMESMIEMIDKVTCDIIGVHVSSAMEQLAREGYWTGGPPPFGYSIRQIDDHEGRKKEGQTIRRAILIPYEPEAVIVRCLYEIAATTGFGGHRVYQALCRELGHVVLGRKGKPLGGRGVNDILRRPIYKGLLLAERSPLVGSPDISDVRNRRTLCSQRSSHGPW